MRPRWRRAAGGAAVRGPGRARGLAAVALISGAALFHQLSLTRVFAVSGWYHYIFMVVSLALLGYGASGTALAVVAGRRGAPGSDARRSRRPMDPALTWCGALFAASVLAGHVIVNALPFDAFRVALEPWQLGRLGVHYAVLAVPFFFAGLLVGGFLADPRFSPPVVYASSLGGSAAGCLVALPALARIPEGALPIAAGLIALCATVVLLPAGVGRAVPCAVATAVAVGLGVLALGRDPFPVAMSPYKSLRSALAIPSSRVLATLRNSYARVDVIESPAIHYAPGLSHRYEGPLPVQLGVATDGENLMGVSGGELPQGLLDAMPFSVAFELGRFRLGPGGGTGVVVRHGGGFELAACLERGMEVTVADDNPLLAAALDRVAPSRPRRPTRVSSDPRGELARRSGTADAVFFPLGRSYAASAAGSFCLSADHLATLEASEAAVRAVRPGGVVVVQTWLHNPPTDSARTVATLIEACGRQGLTARECLVGVRSFMTATWVVKKGAVTPEEKAAVRGFCSRWGFDLIWLGGMEASEANRFIRVTRPVDFELVSDLLRQDAAGRRAVLAAYPFDIRPATDDRPFFASFFRWSQLPSIARLFGRAWLPFGGAGFLVFPALVAISLLASATFVIPAIVLVRPSARGTASSVAGAAASRAPEAAASRAVGAAAYAGLLGTAYMFVELPVIEKLVLAAGNPTSAFSVGLAVLLGLSGLGSMVSSRPAAVRPGASVAPERLTIRRRAAAFAAATAAAAAAYPLLFGVVVTRGMSMPGWARLVLSAVALCPLGFLMGIPFPLGLVAFAGGEPRVVAVSWAANGCASVVSGVVAQMVVMLAGYGAAIRAGALFYALAATVAALPVLVANRVSERRLTP